MITINDFARQSKMFGYSTITTDSKGRQTVSQPTRNVGGTPTFTNTAGKTTKNVPDANLTGFPVVSNDPAVIKSLSGQDASGKSPVSLPATGNITGWPTITTNPATGQQGVIPGYANEGSIQYNEFGIPYTTKGESNALGISSFAPPRRTQAQSSAFSFLSPEPLPQAPSSPSQPKAVDNSQSDIIKAMGQQSKRRGRNSFSQFLLGF